MSILIFALILSFLVIIHELGHFLAARWAKITVEEFGLGYPPKLKKLFSWRGTEFSLNWIPFGGFVRMAGEEGVIEGGSKTKKKATGMFYQASLPQRLVVILAGATVNFVFGVLAFAIIFTKMGIPQPLTEARIAQVAPDSPAAQAGVPENVNVISVTVDGQTVPINSSEKLVALIQDNRGKNVTIATTGQCQQLECQEIAQSFDVYLRTEQETPANQGSLGIAFEQAVFVHYPWWQMPFKSAAYGLQQALGLGMLILQALGTMVQQMVGQGVVSEDLAGPVGIVHQAEESGLFSEGFLAILSFTGMLSINLAIMNVLPIPPLDGGRALFIVLENFFGKNATQKVERVVNYGGYVLLLTLIVLVTARDIFRLFT